MLTRHRDHLDALAAAGRRRALRPAQGCDFASNDYLGLAASTELAAAVREALGRGVAVGSGGSRLLRGNHPEHEALEAAAAAFFGHEAALYFSSGYAANAALLATLPQRGDLVVHDALVHASMHEGLRLGRAEAVAAQHNDPQAFADAAARWRRNGGMGSVWIAVESLYSMDGDRAPLGELAAVADANDAFLIVDEAHATGVCGDGGRGLAASLPRRDTLVLLHTCGKALGCEGALVLAPAVLVDFLVNRARPFIFSTAPSPLMAAAVRAGLGLVADGQGRRDRLATLVGHAGHRLADHLGVPPSGSQIVPVVLGGDARAMTVASRLQAQGFDIRGIRPPTVPDGTARLRLSITLNIDEPAIDALVDALGETLAGARAA